MVEEKTVIFSAGNHRYLVYKIVKSSVSNLKSNISKLENNSNKEGIKSCTCIIITYERSIILV